MGHLDASPKRFRILNGRLDLLVGMPWPHLRVSTGSLQASAAIDPDFWRGANGKPKNSRPSSSNHGLSVTTSPALSRQTESFNGGTGRSQGRTNSLADGRRRPVRSPAERWFAGESGRAAVRIDRKASRSGRPSAASGSRARECGRDLRPVPAEDRAITLRADPRGVDLVHLLPGDVYRDRQTPDRRRGPQARQQSAMVPIGPALLPLECRQARVTRAG